jgi:hypothetical protein
MMGRLATPVLAPQVQVSAVNRQDLRGEAHVTVPTSPLLLLWE